MIKDSKRSRKRRLMSEINVVPYIDVMLVLLVIFMATAPLLIQGVEVQLPKTVSKSIEVSADQPPLIISVKQDGRYYISVGEGAQAGKEQALLLNEITDRVAKVMRRSPETPVLIRGDKGVMYGVVIELMSAIQGVGAVQVGLITEPI